MIGKWPRDDIQRNKGLDFTVRFYPTVNEMQARGC